jgi:hypothetical protein
VQPEATRNVKIELSLSPHYEYVWGTEVQPNWFLPSSLHGSEGLTSGLVRSNPGKYPDTHRRLNGPPGPFWTGAVNLVPIGIHSPDRPTRTESLYRLSCPSPYLLQYVRDMSSLVFNSHGRSSKALSLSTRDWWVTSIQITRRDYTDRITTSEVDVSVNNVTPFVH